MKKAFETAWNAATPTVAAAIVIFILWFAARSHARMWQLALPRYSRKATSTAIGRKLEAIVIAARGMDMPIPVRNWRNYPVMLAVHEDGISLSLMPPLNPLCSPLFLPFDEMALERTDWALWPEPFALRMRRLSDTDIIIGRDTVRWIREHIDREPFGS